MRHEPTSAGTHSRPAHTAGSRLTSLTLALLGVGWAATAGPAAVQAQTNEAVSLRTLATRADLVSGASTLVEVALPPGASTSGLTVTLDGADVSTQFAKRSNGRVEGLLTGLRLGDNTLAARLADGRGARLTV